MSEKRPETSTTVYSDSYAPYGQITTGPPERPSKTPEQFAADRMADRVKHHDLMRELKWSDTDYETAKTLGFPARILYVHTSRGVENIYSRRRVAAWANELKAMAARLK